MVALVESTYFNAETNGSTYACSNSHTYNNFNHNYEHNTYADVDNYDYVNNHINNNINYDIYNYVNNSNC